MGQHALNARTPVLMIDLVSGDSRTIIASPVGISALDIAGTHMYAQGQ